MTSTTTNEVMSFDVVIVGGGPAGLSAAISIKQQALKNNLNLDVCLIEKSSEIGKHIVSGAVFEPTALNELIPDWQQKNFPITTKVTDDKVYFLKNKQLAINIPPWALPKSMNNNGNYIISLSKLCKSLAKEAESLGVNIFTGFSIVNFIIDNNDKLIGVVTGEMGINANGQKKTNYVASLNILAKYTIFAEGCHGDIAKRLIAKYQLDKNKTPQHYALGIKEIWKVDKDKHKQGLVIHTAGWPLTENQATGGGFIYHFENDLVSIGLITDLSYKNPYLSPFEEMQRFKNHAIIKKTLQNGTRISYGAKTMAKGGLQSQIKMTFLGGVLIGDEIGTINASKMKGIHTAMKSGMLAAESIVNAIKNNRCHDELTELDSMYQESWLYDELKQQRNFSPALAKWGVVFGTIYNFIDLNICKGKLPWTLQLSKPDYLQLNKAKNSKLITYQKPDNIISFNRLSSINLSAINHNHDQPNHIKLTDVNLPLNVNFVEYAEPAQYYCPAEVFEIVLINDIKYFKINSQNCLHCKTCDIKDPSQNITWTTPEGGSGPNYQLM